MPSLKIRHLQIICSVMLFLVTTATEAKQTCSEDTLCIETIQHGDKIDFFAINKKQLQPISSKVTLKLKNMKVTRGQNIPTVLSGGEKKYLFTLAPKNAYKAWKYSFHYYWVRGDITAVHDENHVYALPYSKNGKYRVSQGCNGKFSHFDDSLYAIDFSMPVGTPVHAARGGKVVNTKENSNKGGNSKKYDGDANFIIIQHSDNTLGLYYHLQKNGVKVKMGNFVKKGDLIGYSGNTGYSSGPHLHFEVSYAAKDFSNDLTVPITFQTRNGKRTCLKAGTYP